MLKSIWFNLWPYVFSILYFFMIIFLIVSVISETAVYLIKYSKASVFDSFCLVWCSHSFAHWHWSLVEGIGVIFICYWLDRGWILDVNTVFCHIFSRMEVPLDDLFKLTSHYSRTILKNLLAQFWRVLPSCLIWTNINLN